MPVDAPANILVPTDFSDHSKHALRYAASLAERFGATLHLVHVLTVHGLEGRRTEQDIPDLTELLDRADRAARERLDRGAVHGGEAETAVVKRVLRGINAWDPILEYARSEPVDFIVMAMHSGSRLARYLMGSVSERVLRFAPCPVLLVEKGDRDFLEPETMAVRLERIVVADDLSPKSQAALRWAVRWLEPYRPDIHVMHAVEIEVPTPYQLTGVDSVFSLDSELRPRLMGVLQERATEVVPEGWPLVTVVREGRAHKVLTRYAREIEADLLVVAGESRIDLAERILGGTVERIARHAPCPLLMV